MAGRKADKGHTCLLVLSTWEALDTLKESCYFNNYSHTPFKYAYSNL